MSSESEQRFLLSKVKVHSIIMKSDASAACAVEKCLLYFHISHFAFHILHLTHSHYTHLQKTSTKSTSLDLLPLSKSSQYFSVTILACDNLRVHNFLMNVYSPLFSLRYDPGYYLTLSESVIHEGQDFGRLF